jgi:pre-mRNA-processing factor 19
VSLQNEFDAVMIETFELKKQFLELQTQLSNCLYENDAAKRVIARLLQERDLAKKTLLNFKQPEPEQDVEMDVSEPLPEPIMKEMDKVYATLFEQRRTKKKEAINIKLLSTYQPKTHKTMGTPKLQRVTTIDILNTLTLAGAQDGSLTVVDQQAKQVSTIKAHKKEIVALKFVDQAHFLSADEQELKFWSLEPKKNAKPKQEWSKTSNVTSINIHPCGNYFITTTNVGYELLSIETGESIIIKNINSGLVCGKIHPDGLIFGTGNVKGVVSIYDLKTNTKAFELNVFENAVTGLEFSENGYHMCAWSNQSGKVSFFDLRKVADTKEVMYSMSVSGVCQVRFEPSGKYVGVADDKSMRY